MDEKLILCNARVAGPPTFFPGLTPDKHRTLLTVIKNRGKNKAGQPLSDEYTLVMWGKYAQTGALYFTVGRALNVECVPRSYSVDTGRLKPNGKKEIYRLTNFHVRSFEFGADSKKELSARINQNIMTAKAAGQIDQNATVTAEILLAVTRPQKVDYNPAVHNATGMYGNAKIFIKGQGFAGPGTAVATGQPTVEQLEAQLAQLKAAPAGAEGTDANAFVAAT